MNARTTQKPKKNERGVILIWVGMFLLLILCFASLGVDMAKLMAARTQLQNAADAAALAGASAVDWNTGVLDADTAVVRAQAAAFGNKAFIDTPQPIVLAAADVVVFGGDHVKVTVRREGGNSVVTTLAQVLGITALEMKATATAKVTPNIEVMCGIVPIGVSPPPGEVFEPGCSPGYVLKVGGGTGSNGNYGAVTFPACDQGPCAGMGSNGANTFRCLVEHGFCCSINIGDEITTEPGNLSSFRKAVEARFKNDTDARQHICYSEYTGNGQRVMILPVTTDLGSGSGRVDVTVLRFAAFFVKNIPGNGTNSTLEGEFVYYVAPGLGNSGSSSGVTTYAVQLVE